MKQVSALVVEQDKSSAFERMIAERLLVTNAGYLPAIAAGWMAHNGLVVVAGAMAVSSIYILTGALRAWRINKTGWVYITNYPHRGDRINQS